MRFKVLAALAIACVACAAGPRRPSSPAPAKSDVDHAPLAGPTVPDGGHPEHPEPVVREPAPALTAWPEASEDIAYLIRALEEAWAWSSRSTDDSRRLLFAQLPDLA